MDRVSASRLGTVVLLGLLAILGSTGSSSSAGAAETPPNIIFLLTDDQRWDTLGVSGNSIIQTPNLDQLARQGVRFDNVFVTTSICATSRASILTGQYARRHGIWDFLTGLTEEQLAGSYLGRLKEAGYHLGFVGKWGVADPPKDYFDYDRAFSGQGQYRLEVDGQERHLTSVMGDQIVEFLQGAPADRPFCLSVSFKAAHVQDSYDLSQEPFPYDPRLESLYQEATIPPPPSALPTLFESLPEILQNSEARLRWAIRFWGPARYQESVKGYYRLISGVDDVVGRLRQTLNERGLSEQTAIVFTGDNGFFLGEFGLAGKWTPHEASIRVPLVIFDPRLSEQSVERRVDHFALNIDMAPTLLGLAGLPPGEEMQGRSLVPLLHGEGEDGGWRESFFYEHLFTHPRIPRSEAVRTKDWKYIRYVDSEPLYEELYDLESDPHEMQNLAAEAGHGGRLQELRTAWARWRKQVE